MKVRVLATWIFVMICLNTINAQQKIDKSATADGNSSVKKSTSLKEGAFISLGNKDGVTYRAYAAGPEDAKAGILFVHDYFGITPATKEAVERLGALGYRTVAVDLYKGKSATTNDSANELMKAKDRKETDHILQDGIDYLKRPGRKLATIGFSAGGVDAMNANLMDPDAFNATVIIYGGGYDKIEKARLEQLKSPVLAITGALDEWPVQAALHFFVEEKGKAFEIYIYPGADHGYAQPLFNGGKNYNAEATRLTWKLTEDFLTRHLNNGNKLD